MKVIVAGMSKTGTKSIAKAMKILGYEVHDTMEHFRYHRQVWYDFLDDKAGIEDIRKSYEGVDVVTDMPVYYFWEQLHEAYPEAKILFTTRDEMSWIKSAVNQRKKIESDKYLNMLMTLSPTGWQLFSFYQTNAPKDKLLVYSVKQGWGPLCEFLGVEMPQVPFPHQNVRGNLFEERLQSDPTIQRMKREACLTVSILFLLLTVAGYYLMLL